MNTREWVYTLLNRLAKRKQIRIMDAEEVVLKIQLGRAQGLEILKL
jgi:hypothetical protein